MRAEGIGANVRRAWHLNVDVLPRQEVQRLIEGDHQLDGGIGQTIHLSHLRPGVRQGGFTLRGGHRHIDNAVAGRHHLAGQHLAGLRFLIA